MTNQQSRIIAIPWVMVAGSLYAFVREEFAILIGSAVFLGGVVLFIIEYARSYLKNNHDKG